MVNDRKRESRLASSADVEAAFKDSKLAQVLYHDWESITYDEKWSISFDERCIDYAVERFTSVVPEGKYNLPYEVALEIGCGTGFFLLNLMQGGIIKKGNLTDISSGMVEVALANAKKLSLPVEGKVGDAEKIPFPDNSFDLVVGHAILHHIPEAEVAFKEILRVLKPGGRFVFAGEPSKIGDKYARFLGNLTWKLTTNLTKLPFLTGWRRPQQELDESSRVAALEAVVDLHTFDPTMLKLTAIRAGASEVRVHTDELIAAMVGWPIRTFEAAVPAGKLGLKWANFAYRLWFWLARFDNKILSKFISPKYYYNVSITGVKGTADYTR